MPQDCIFCMISKGQLTSEILRNGDHCFAIRDISPKAPVHLLIIPHQHFTHLTYLTPKFYPILGEMFRLAKDMAVEEGIESKGYRLIINQGDHAGQVIPHLHLHLLAGKSLNKMG